MQYKELLLGCGNNLDKKIKLTTDNWQCLTTLDVDVSCHPDIIWDLENLPLPFEDNSFDEIHAYEVLEHTGSQGDFRFFFNQFSDFWRVLKSGGLLMGTCPRWDRQWAWGDPGHKRVIQKETFSFLDQTNYSNIGKTPMTDYRSIYQADFKVLETQDQEYTFSFVLKTMKPIR